MAKTELQLAQDLLALITSQRPTYQFVNGVLTDSSNPNFGLPQYTNTVISSTTLSLR